MILQVQDLCKSFQRGDQAFLAVDKVSLELDAGQLAVVSGSSGCGKSTLFNMIAALIKPDSGSLHLFEKDLAQLSASQLSILRRTELAYILQGKALLPQLTVLENVCLPAFLGDSNITTLEEAHALLAELGLEKLANSYPAYLSGGEQRRVAVARSLSYGAKLILADEPCSNLDQANAEAVMSALRWATQNGAAVLMSSHDLNWAQLADKSYEMSHGRFV